MKNPFENKNKLIRIKGPTPNTKRTIFAVLGVVFVSSFAGIVFAVNFFLDFCLGIFEISSEINNSSYKLRVELYEKEIILTNDTINFMNLNKSQKKNIMSLNI